MSSHDARDRKSALRTALLVPLVGPLHLTFPAYNTVTVREVLEAAAPSVVLTTALEPGALEDPSWQDTPEIALPHMVGSWADARGTPVQPIGVPSPDPAATEDFARYAEQYPALRSAWLQAERQEAPLRDLLSRPLPLTRIVDEAMPLLAEAQQVREAAFGDGPATDWLRQRTAEMAAAVAPAVAQHVVMQPAGPHPADPHAAGTGPVAVLASLDHLPLLHEALQALDVPVAFPTAPPASERARRRGFLDYAMRVDVAEPEEVLRSLRDISGPEARYHEANILLAHGHGAEALERLEEASRGDFVEPYWLPGFLLARLGQLHDLAGNREAALRAYRGVRALSWAPPEARVAAARGIEAPFAPEKSAG